MEPMLESIFIVSRSRITFLIIISGCRLNPTRGNTAKRPFVLKEKDIQYWLRQPIPVFVFILNLNECPSSSEFILHVVDLSIQVMDGILPSEKPRPPLRSNYLITDAKTLDYFINAIVPTASSVWLVREGVVRSIRLQVHESHIKEYPSKSLVPFASKLLKTIGRTSALLMRDIVFNNRGLVNERKQLEDILQTFAAYGNNDFHVALGLSLLLDGKTLEAKAKFELAIRCILRDARLSELHRDGAISHIENLIKQCQK